jgi:O-antigen/teichoic acid export membrane protein
MHKIRSQALYYLHVIRRIFRLTSHDVSTEEGKSDERYRRVILSGVSTAIVKIVSVGINLITVPLTINYLGAERYGLWMAISSFLALLSFSDLGLGNGLLNAVSRANGNKSNNEARIAVSSTFFLLIIIASVLLIGFFSIYSFISWPDVFNVKSPTAVKESGPTMMALVFIVLINMPLGVIQRIQEGYQEGYRFQLWLIVGSILSLLGLLICVHFKSGLVWLVIAFSSGQLLATFLNGIFLFKSNRPYLKPKFNNFDLTVGKQLIKSGLVFFLLGLFTLLGNATDNIIIAQILGAKSVAGYEIVKKIFLFSMVTQFIIQPLWPAFAEALESGDIVWARKTLGKGIFLSTLIILIITFPFLIFGRPIIVLWVGEDFLPSWSLLFGFYAFVVLANYGGVMSTFLNSGPLIAKQTFFVGIASISALVLKIILSLKFGISGIIWATVIGYGVFYIIPSYRLAYKYLDRLEDQKKN